MRNFILPGRASGGGRVIRKPVTFPDAAGSACREANPQANSRVWLDPERLQRRDHVGGASRNHAHLGVQFQPVGPCLPWHLRDRVSPEECAAGTEEGQIGVRPFKQSLIAHLSRMRQHPAARCFRDAYAAGKAVAEEYLSWMSRWMPVGGEITDEGCSQILDLRAIDNGLSAFYSHLDGYFSDCKWVFSRRHWTGLSAPADTTWLDDLRSAAFSVTAAARAASHGDRLSEAAPRGIDSGRDPHGDRGQDEA